MTKDEALKLALEALEKSEPNKRKGDDDCREIGWMEHREAITAIKAALEAKDEPVAWVCEGFSSDEKHAIDYWQGDVDDLPIGTQLYTTPPQRTWVGLTDVEIASVEYNNHPLNGIRSFAKAIEAKLKEKNT